MEQKVFGFPLKTFKPENLLEEMLEAKEGQIFLLGENKIKNHEGYDTLELIFAEIKRYKD